MKIKLFKQLIESGAFEEFKNTVISNIDNEMLKYKAGSKTDKSIASDIKAFSIAKEMIEKVLNSLETTVKLDRKKNQSFK